MQEVMSAELERLEAMFADAKAQQVCKQQQCTPTMQQPCTI
jgi:hypothetical protein